MASNIVYLGTQEVSSQEGINFMGIWSYMTFHQILRGFIFFWNSDLLEFFSYIFDKSRISAKENSKWWDSEAYGALSWRGMWR
jgi:hypothetical protein